MLTLSLLGSPWGQRPKNYLPSMSKKYKMKDVTPRRLCMSHFFFNGTNFWREGTGDFRLSGEQIWKSIWNEHKIITWSSIGSISTPNDYLNTVFDDVVSLPGSCENNALSRSPWEKLQLVAFLSLCVLQERNTCYLQIVLSNRNIFTWIVRRALNAISNRNKNKT